MSSDTKQRLLDKLNNHTARVAIIGIDVEARKIDAINAGCF